MKTNFVLNMRNSNKMKNRIHHFDECTRSSLLFAIREKRLSKLRLFPIITCLHIPFIACFTSKNRIFFCMLSHSIFSSARIYSKSSSRIYTCIVYRPIAFIDYMRSIFAPCFKIPLGMRCFTIPIEIYLFFLQYFTSMLH